MRLLYERSVDESELDVKDIEIQYNDMLKTIVGDYERQKLIIQKNYFYTDEVREFDVYLIKDKLYVFLNILFDGDLYFEAYEIDNCGELEEIINDGITPDKYKIIDSIAIQLTR